MKKLFLTLFTLSLVNMSATAQLEQYNQRPNGDHYLTPDSYGNPINLDVFVFDSTTGRFSLYDHSMIGSILTPPGGDDTNTLYDIAQPCYSDTLLTIIGIAGLFTGRYYCNMNAYLHIADTNFNINRTVKIPQTERKTQDDYDTINKNYTEIFLEQPINVQGRFLVIWDNPKPNATNAQYEFDYNYNPQVKYAAGLFANNNVKDADAIYKYLPYQRHWSNDTLSDWEKECEVIVYIFNTPVNRYCPRIYYLFPIFGELDTTLECVGCGVDSGDVGLANNNIIDMYTNVFPNPVKEELNVQCSFRIKEIEIYNVLGQKVLDKRVQGYNTTINTSSLTKGSYTLRVKTQSGVVNKKFIVE